MARSAARARVGGVGECGGELEAATVGRGLEAGGPGHGAPRGWGCARARRAHEATGGPRVAQVQVHGPGRTLGGERVATVAPGHYQPYQPADTQRKSQERWTGFEIASCSMEDCRLTSRPPPQASMPDTSARSGSRTHDLRLTTAAPCQLDHLGTDPWGLGTRCEGAGARGGPIATAAPTIEHRPRAAGTRDANTNQEQGTRRG